jgi:uncharacterized protein (TIGR03790 family)
LVRSGIFAGVCACLLAAAPPAPTAAAPSAQNVLLVVNRSDPVSRRIGEYYVHKRHVPLANVCAIETPPRETIAWDAYRKEVEAPVAQCLTRGGLAEQILYIVTTLGVPLRVSGQGAGPGAETAALDSELTLLYSRMKGLAFKRAGAFPNPFFKQRDEPFAHPRFPIYLVTRLAGYSFEDVRGIIDRALAAQNRGRFVIDLKSGDDEPGNGWLRSAAIFLPAPRVVFNESSEVLTGQRDVIGYASWGSNDRRRKLRNLGFQWLPGAIVTEFVSSNGRTFRKPPENWELGTWDDRSSWFAGSPQTMAADYIHQGATGCSGHVDEPYLVQTPRPEFLFPAYYRGRNLAESYYLAIPSLSWQNIVIGDPLCSLGKPR